MAAHSAANSTTPRSFFRSLSTPAASMGGTPASDLSGRCSQTPSKKSCTALPRTLATSSAVVIDVPGRQQVLAVKRGQRRRERLGITELSNVRILDAIRLVLHALAHAQHFDHRPGAGCFDLVRLQRDVALQCFDGISVLA